MPGTVLLHTRPAARRPDPARERGRPYTSRMTPRTPHPALPLPPASALDAFRAKVWDYYRANRREMPWRDLDDPYAVLVSEVMLQQTQVARVESRFPEWMDTFPTIDALAAAPLPLVLEAWQGLGYNRRAMALKRSADLVVERFGGIVPRSVPELLTLPGVGPATAAAVVTYACRVPVPFIETNVRAAVLHDFFADADDVPDRDVMPIVAATWDADDPRGWGYALMDYGSHLKRTGPNPSRRSRHHVRQSRFEGSRRQKRARLLRMVLADPGRTADDYAGAAGLDIGETDALLQDLGREGFVGLTAGRWSVPD
jgi:A/G-specific adenine glycosylase